jgi:hypothetical protein
VDVCVATVEVDRDVEACLELPQPASTARIGIESARVVRMRRDVSRAYS